MMEPREYVWGFAVATAEEAVPSPGKRDRKAGADPGVRISGGLSRALVRLKIRPAVFTLEMAEAMSRTAGEAGNRSSHSSGGGYGNDQNRIS